EYLPRSLYGLGACAKEQAQWPASQKHYEALIAQFPDFELIHEARFGLGWALQSQDKLDDAVKVYEQVTKATTTEAAAKSRFQIGECGFKQEKDEEAIKHYIETYSAYPYERWQVDAYLAAGICFRELKKPQQAIECFETLVKKFPNHPRAKEAATQIANLKK